MISVSDRQLRIVAAAADLLPSEARATLLQRVAAELRERRDFSAGVRIEPAGVLRGGGDSAQGIRQLAYAVQSRATTARAALQCHG